MTRTRTPPPLAWLPEPRIPSWQELMSEKAELERKGAGGGAAAMWPDFGALVATTEQEKRLIRPHWGMSANYIAIERF